MGVSVDIIYQRCQALSNKSAVGGWLNPTDFNNYANMASLSVVNQLFAQFQRTQKISDVIKPLVKRKQTWINSSTGILQFPSDYLYFLSLRTYKRDKYLEVIKECGETPPTIKDFAGIPQIPIKLIDSDKLAVLNQSEKYTPNYEYPYAEETLSGFHIYPLDLGYALFTYLKQPAEVIWAYTTDPIYGLPIYDAANSVDFEYDDTAANMLVMEICKHFGIEIRDAELSQATSQLEATGE